MGYYQSAQNRKDKGNNRSKTLNNSNNSKKKYLKEVKKCQYYSSIYFKYNYIIQYQIKVEKAQLASKKGKVRVALEGKEKVNIIRILKDSSSKSKKFTYLLPNIKVIASL